MLLRANRAKSRPRARASQLAARLWVLPAHARARPAPHLPLLAAVQLLKAAEVAAGGAPAKPKRPRALVLGPTRELTGDR